MAALRHDDDELETPDSLFQMIQDRTGLEFDFDLCANEHNKKTKNYTSNCFDTSFEYYTKFNAIWCNPPRSKNGKVLKLIYDIYDYCDTPIAVLLCWNDLGNKYGHRLLHMIQNNQVSIINLGKIYFYKNKKITKFPSRLTYFCAILRHV